jgi:uncharacterized protein with beta-barrel porin domain
MKGDIVNSGTISVAMTVTGGGFGSLTGVLVIVSTFTGNIVNSGTISVSASYNGGEVAAYGLILESQSFTGSISNGGTIAASAVGTGFAQVTAVQINSPSFTGQFVNNGTIRANRTSGAGSGTAIGINVVDASKLTIINAGTISGTDYGIDLADNFWGPGTIDQNGGAISGGVAAILFSADGDTLNINGGAINGNLVGTGGTGATINIQPGTGNAFAYGNTMSGIGAVNLKSGTLELTNSGKAAPGGTIHTVSYTQSAGSTLAIEVTPITGVPAVAGTGSVNASGAMTLAGTFEAIALPGTFKPGQANTYDNVLSWGTLAGNFTSVTSISPLFGASLVQSGNADNLVLTVLSPSAVPGLDANQKAIVAALENTNGPIPADQLFTLGPQQLGAALTSVAGEENTQNSHLTAGAWQSFTDMLLDRLFTGGGGATTTGSFTPGGGVQFAQADEPQQQQVADASPSLPTPGTAQRWGVWARGYSLSADAPATASSAPYSESGAGIVVGADNQITDRLVAGIAVNLSTDKASVTGGGQTLIDSYQGAAYANYALDPNWYASGIAGFSWQSYSSLRLVTVAATSIANASYAGQGYRAYGETGYALHPAFLADQSLTLTPFVGLGYLHTHSESYTETGSPFALAVGAIDANSLTTNLGARASLAWQVGGTIFRPEIRAAWQHEWLDASSTVHSAFAQAPAAVFTVTGTAFSREAFVGGAGISSDITGSTRLFVDYDAKLNGGYVAQVVSGGLRVAF